jgi:hypothetical protein
VRKRQDLQRQQKEQAAARRLESSSIGAGGLRVKDGGSIIVEAGGDITLEDGDFVAGTVTAGTVTGATTVSAGTSVTAPAAVISGDVTAHNLQLGANGTVWSTYALNNPVTTGYFALYVNSDGRVGRTPSARKYKQDIANFSPSEQAVFAIQLRQFRIKAAVAELGDNAPIEHGLIAEELVELGLDWLVLFGPGGEPEGIAYEKVALALIPAVQEHERMAQDHERRIAALEAQAHT